MGIKEIFKDKKTWYFLVIMIFSTTLVYLNHFDNGFHFDDSHTILDNPSIKSLKNIPSFFVDGTLSSSFPQNQTYRPLVTTTTAIDYWLADGYNPFFFHLSNFIFFILQGILLFLFIYKICELTKKGKFNFYIAALSTGFYMLHPAMAETVNYIIARSDIQSTFFVLLGFVLFQYSAVAKKYYLYLIPILLGALAKPTAIMFAPLLVVYLLLFETNESKNSLNFPNFTKAINKSLIALVFCFGLYFFISNMSPKTYDTGGGDLFNYLITQPAVLSYYFGSLFFPIGLSADTDWIPFEFIFSIPTILGFIFLVGFIYTIFLCLKKKELKPIAFGLLWFLIALAPTSSFIPLAEVLNDHRMYFPFTGLVLALGWALSQLYLKVKNEYSWRISYKIIVPVILFALFGFGTFQRNMVWDNDESLWKDVTKKSPKNGRGWMNYGLSEMRKGNYDNAEVNFTKALKFTPKYHTLHTNLGILNNAKGNIAKAEESFKNAITFGPMYYTPYYFYGDFLSKQNRYTEAIENLNKSYKIAPTHISTINLLLQDYLELGDWKNLKNTLAIAKKIQPKNPELIKYEIAVEQKIDKLSIEEQFADKNKDEKAYLALSHKYFLNGNFKKCIEISEKAIKLNENSAIAYNNVCSSHNALGNFEAAKIACKKAIKIDPNFQLAKSNLNDAIIKKQQITDFIKELEVKQIDDSNYLGLSLLYFKYGLFQKSVEIVNEGLHLFPKSDNLYNNLCAAYNELNEWENAIIAGKKGLVINPENQLLKNNYNWAKKNIIE